MNEKFINALRSYKGLQWGQSTVFHRVRDGKPIGTCSCVGLILLGLRDIGLLAPGFDVNLSRLAIGPARVKFLRSLILDFAEPVLQAAPGDILLSRWSDVDRRAPSVHHILVVTELAPLYQSHIQSLAREHGGAGCVYESLMSPLDWERVEEIWRLR